MKPTGGKVAVTVNQAVCVGNASCVGTAPGVFALDENRQSTVVDPEGASWERILEAAENCPVAAISLKDAATGDSVFP